MTAVTIAERSFSADDLQWFAAASGDWNPIHVDSVAARRLLVGEVVVHGMFALLWALDAYAVTDGAVSPAAIRATFLRPILPGELLALRREQDTAGDSGQSGVLRLSIGCGADTRALIELAGVGGPLGSKPAPARPQREQPEVRMFSELKDARGSLPVSALPEDLRGLFPQALDLLGPMPVATLMGLSRLVGMHCPGLHSLFSSVDLALSPAQLAPEIQWQVQRHSVPQAPLRIAVGGGGLSGRLDAFVRPAPVAQYAMQEVAAVVPPGTFAGQVALIVGGSRGMGELTAKIVAAGGGEAIVTYARGRQDAECVAQEIAAHGGKCRLAQLDVRSPGDALDTVLRIGAAPTHLYYFAAPRIVPSRNGAFDAALYRNFGEIFVESFARLVTDLHRRLPGGLRVFYPSTVFIDELPRDFPEYVAAKAAGEALCRHLERHVPGLRILVLRWPRLPTDQTAGLLRRAMAEPIPQALAAVRDMHAMPDEADRTREQDQT